MATNGTPDHLEEIRVQYHVSLSSSNHITELMLYVLRFQKS